MKGFRGVADLKVIWGVGGSRIYFSVLGSLWINRAFKQPLRLR